MNFKEALEAAIEKTPERHTVWLIEELDLDEAPEEIENEIVGEGRWDIHRDAIYKHGGKFWEVSYSEGATEYQESDSYGTEVYEVYPVEVTVTKYARL